MSDSQRMKDGLESFGRVYGDSVPAPPEGSSAFFDTMIKQLFAEVWTREALPLRDRRLLTMGVIAAMGEQQTFAIQVRAAVKNGELTPEQVREVLIHLAQYAGYPRAAGLLGATEKVLAELAAEQTKQD